jgi:hypothetical protein
MLKRIFPIIGLLTVFFLLLAAGLSCSTDKITASLGQEFTLPVGQTAVISGEDLTLKFEEVVGDSRCAKGVECVWAGEAKCRMLITYYKSLSSVIFTQPGGDAVARDFFLQYKISFKLEPYPEYGKQIAGSDYKLVMTVTK